MTTTLPACFPKIAKECTHPGEAFMSCFTKAAVKTSLEDSEAGARGLQACTRELAAYEACMKKFETKQLPKRYRVSPHADLLVFLSIEGLMSNLFELLPLYFTGTRRI